MRTNRFLRIPAGVLLLAAAVGCQGTDSPVPPTGEAPAVPSLLALGDSYTVGHGLSPSASWPHQLADSLAAAGDTLDPVHVIARTGWTTGDLLAALGDRRPSGPYGLVTVMIGVNDQFQGLDRDAFAAGLDSLLGLARGWGETVLVFTIPDYGATPVGVHFGAEAVAREIDSWNEVLRRVAARHGLAPLDVTAPSRAAADEPALVGRDGLHYSAEMYRRWVTLMLPAARAAVGTP